MTLRTWLTGQAGNWEQWSWSGLMPANLSASVWPGSFGLGSYCVLWRDVYFHEACLCLGFNPIPFKEKQKNFFGWGGSKSGMDRKEVQSNHVRQAEEAMWTGRSAVPKKELEEIAETSNTSSWPAGSQRLVHLSLEHCILFIKVINSEVRNILFP